MAVEASNSPPVLARPSAVDALPEVIASARAGCERAGALALVHGGNLRRRTSARNLWRALRGLEYATYIHRGVPTPQSVAELARSLRRDQIEVLVAVGGGALLDAAKGAAGLGSRTRLDAGAVMDACAQPQDKPAATRVLAVPTTAGTGAEVTPFATIWDTVGGHKLSLVGSACVPCAAVLDPCLLEGLPQTTLASGVLDAIAQGAEAAWSLHATDLSIALGLRAVEEVGARLNRVAAGRIDLDDRMALQLAGNRSGHAIAIANTTACHAMSYPLTLRYGLAHGHACGVTFGRLADFNAGVTPHDCADPRGAAWVREMLRRIAAALARPPGGVTERVDQFLHQVGLPRLADLSIDYAAVATDAMSYPRCRDNPRWLDGRLAEVMSAPAEGALRC